MVERNGYLYMYLSPIRPLQLDNENHEGASESLEASTPDADRGAVWPVGASMQVKTRLCKNQLQPTLFLELH